MRPVVLFVDDEPNLISGLKRATRKFRGEWEMYFVVGAEEALKIIPEKRVNTILTDMRMPGIDGAQLLKEISNKWPGIFRIVLSGEADAKTMCPIGGWRCWLGLVWGFLLRCHFIWPSNRLSKQP